MNRRGFFRSICKRALGAAALMYCPWILRAAEIESSPEDPTFVYCALFQINGTGHDPMDLECDGPEGWKMVVRIDP